jgi:hypothetical protein
VAEELIQMRARFIFSGAGLALAFALVGVLPAADQPRTDPIARLIAQLGSASFEDREQASRELEKIGPAALDALRQAAKADDREVRRRADDLLATVAKLVATEKALKPTLVHLVYKDTPLPEAVADFQKKSGCPLVLSDPQNRLADRRLTLDTGEKTFWQALDQFCQAAGLIEADGQWPGGSSSPRRLVGFQQIPLNPVPLPAAPFAPIQLQQQVLQLPVVAGGSANTPSGVMPTQITLAEGTAAPPATHYAGAVRIRALPAGTPVPAGPSPEGVLSFPLQVTPELTMAWQGLAGVRIEKAVDERGRSLREAVVIELTPAQDTVVFGRRGGPGINRRTQPSFGIGNPREVLVHLEQGDRPAKRLQELSGFIAAQVRAAPEALFTVDHILKAAGQSIKGDGGGQLTVVDATREDSGEVTLQIEIELPADVAPAAVGGVENVGMPGPGGPRRAVGGFQGRGGNPRGMQGSPAGGFRLLDDKGTVLPLSVQQVRGQANGEAVTWQLTLAHKREAGQGEPAKLAFHGSRTLTLDIPFMLKEVALP